MHDVHGPRILGVIRGLEDAVRQGAFITVTRTALKARPRDSADSPSTTRSGNSNPVERPSSAIEGIVDRERIARDQSRTVELVATACVVVTRTGRWNHLATAGAANVGRAGLR